MELPGSARIAEGRMDLVTSKDDGVDMLYSFKSVTLSQIYSGPVISLKGDMNTAMAMWPDIWDGVML